MAKKKVSTPPLPYDWKQSVEDEFERMLNWYPIVHKERMLSLLQKPEIAKAAGFLWRHLYMEDPHSKHRTTFAKLMASGIYCVSYTSSTEIFSKRKKTEWRKFIAILEALKDDKILFGHVDGKKRTDEFDRAILTYRRIAEEAHVGKPKDDSRRALHYLYLYVIRELKSLKQPNRFASYFMMAGYGPTWTVEYTRVRAAEWRTALLDQFSHYQLVPYTQ